MTTIRRVTLAAAVAGSRRLRKEPAAPTVVYDRPSLDARYKDVTDMIALPSGTLADVVSDAILPYRSCSQGEKLDAPGLVICQDRRANVELFARCLER
jgi:hypothetical protein